MERLVDLVGLSCPDTLERVHDELLQRAAAVAADRELSVYDAAYMAVAGNHDWDLVSADTGVLVRPGHAISPEAALTSD